MSNSKGKFVISLDFELYWGVRDQRTLESYRQNLLGVRQVVPELLKLFSEFGIHCTWATVGFLFFKDKDGLLQHLPVRKPQYTDQNLSPYPTLAEIGENEEKDPYHFANSLLEQIRKSPGQEIASHTFCHYYCLEPGQTAADFRDDMQAAVRVAEQSGLEMKSLVFPRNQFNAEYLAICKEAGITSYRGNEAAWIYREDSGAGQTKAKRAVRLADSYLNITGHNCYQLSDIAREFPFNIPASRFLRPYSPKLKQLDGLRLQRILSGLTHAAKTGTVFHLWWHPHNFGVYLPENLDFLRKILAHYQQLKTQYGLESVTMAELSDSLMAHK